MGPQGFRRMALGLTGAIEKSHMGHPDFRVRDRIFATLHDDQRYGMVKLTPDQQQQFLRHDSGAFMPEAGAWGRSGCTRVEIALVDQETLGEVMTLAWKNIEEQPARKSTSRRPAARRRSGR